MENLLQCRLLRVPVLMRRNNRKKPSRWTSSILKTILSQNHKTVLLQDWLPHFMSHLVLTATRDITLGSSIEIPLFLDLVSLTRSLTTSLKKKRSFTVETEGESVPSQYTHLKNIMQSQKKVYGLTSIFTNTLL